MFLLFFIKMLQYFAIYGIGKSNDPFFADFLVREEKMTIVYIDKYNKYINMLEQKNILLAFLNAKKINDIQLIEQENIFSNFCALKNAKKLIVASLLCLSDNVTDLKKTLVNLFENKIALISLKEEISLSSQDEMKNFISGFETALILKNQQSSLKIKNSLQQKKENGFKIGRAVGSKNKKKSLCEQNHERILKMLENGESVSSIAAKIGVSIRTLFNYKKQILNNECK